MSHFKRQKIALLLGSLSGAGAEKSVLILAESLAKFGHEIHLIVIENIFDYKPSNNIHIWCLEKIDPNKKKALKYIAHNLTDLDLFVTSRAELYHCPIKCKKRYCSVHITPTAWIKPYKLSLKVWLKKVELRWQFSGKKLLTLSKGIKNDLVDNLGINDQNIKVLHAAYDFQAINSNASIPITPKLDFDYIICVAAFIPRKRHADLLKAFAQLDNKKIHLVLIGKGPLEDELKKQAVSLKIDSKVHFLGWQLNPYAYIKQAKVSVLMAQAEGMPRVLIESIVIGTPVVFTDCRSGPNEILTGDCRSQLVPIGHIDAIRKTIDRTIKNPTIVPKEKVSTFDSEAVARQYLEL